jgi:hypothetical protein
MLSLNFYRIHLTFFTLHPLIWSAIFWAANGRYPVEYIDALFLCFSAQTVTGLSSVNLSSLTGFQQAILFWYARQSYDTRGRIDTFLQANDNRGHHDS